jgi:hypothetical protein
MAKRILIIRKVGGLYFLTPKEMATEAGMLNAAALDLNVQSKKRVPDAVFDGQETKEAAVALAESVGCKAVSYAKLRADAGRLKGFLPDIVR